MPQKKTAARGRPSKGTAAKAKTIQVRVDAKAERHVKTNGGSAFVRDLIVKSMEKPKKPVKGAIVNGPKPKAVSDAMRALASKTGSAKSKELAAETGNYRQAAVKEGAKASKANQPTAKPVAKKSAAKPFVKSKAASKKK